MSDKNHHSGKRRRLMHSYAAPLQRPRAGLKVQEINAGTQVDNHEAAKRFKLLLDLDELHENDGSKATSTKIDASHPGRSATFAKLYGTPSHYMESMLAKAYRESYRRHKIDPEALEETEDDGHPGTSGECCVEECQMEVSSLNIDPGSGQGRVKEEELGAGDPQGHKKLTTKVKEGQRVGLGVVGQPHWTMEDGYKEEHYSDDEDIRSRRFAKLVKRDPPTMVVPTLLGCDIPMPFNDNPALPIQLKESLRKARLPYKLDASLPPLALDHPARVWNVMLHSMDRHERPGIKWSFEEDSQDGVFWHCATMTLHRRTRTGRADSEVCSEGQVWTSAWRESKIDSMNDALVKAIRDGALEALRK